MDISFVETKTITELKEYLTRLANDVDFLKKSTMLTEKQQIYSNPDLMKLLKVNTTTLKSYRDEGLLGFSQVRDKYFYTAKDVAEFLKRTHYEPFYWD